MASRDAEIKAVAAEINELVNDLNAVVAALNGILSPTTTSRQEDEPDDRQRRPAAG